MRKLFTLRYLFCLSIFALSNFSFAQTTVSWNFGTTAGTASPSAGTPVSNLTVSDLSQGNANGITPFLTTTSPSSATPTYTGNSGLYNAGNAARIGALNTATAGSAYFEFTLTPAAGFTVDLSAVNFGTRSTATGPQAYSIRTSKDNYATDAASGTISNTSVWALKSSAVSSVTSAAGTAVTIRIYAHSGAGSPGIGTANWRIDDLAITVTVNNSGADVTPPVVTSLTPANGATNVAINTNLQILFSENIQTGAGNILVRKFSDNSIVQTIDVATAAVVISNKTAAISINTLANSTGYYIEVSAGAFKDIAGNNFAGISGNGTWKFDTQSTDITPPVISALSPPNNATGVALNTPLQITFNENIQKGTTGNIVIKKFSDNSVVQTIAVTSPSVTVTNSIATISINQLSYSTAYYIEVDAGTFQDISGNNFAGISGNTNWVFTTASQPAAGIIGKNYDFNNCSSFLSDGFRQYSVSGPQFWSCTNFGRTYSGTGTSSDSAIQMNGFVTTYVPNEDWFISPPYNLSGANSPTLKFYTRTKFAGSNLVLKVSTNYSGTGDPNLATWINLNGKFPAANSDIWTLSDSIDLAPYSVPNVYLAWVYTSNSTSAARTTLDDIRVYTGCTPPSSQPTALNLTSTITTISGSFTTAAAPADAYLIIRSTSPTLSVQPSPGIVYAGDDVLGNGTIISAGNNLSFTINNLNPSTQYYFFVYAYVAAQSCYNITNPLTGNISTLASPNCTPPNIQASSLNGAVTSNSINLTYSRGNGNNILIVARKSGAVNQNPIVGVNYPAGSEIGSGNFVIYNGPAANFSYTALTQNTSYYFALYEYFNTNFCYNLSPLAGNFTTSCITPVNVSSLNAAAGNTQVSVSWINPTASCFDEVLVVASNAPITGQGSDFTGSANPNYTTPNQVVFRGIGSNVTVTGLINATSYYFKVFTKIGSIYSTGVSISATPFDPASGFVYLYGNLHSHSSYSDGNKDNTSKKPIDDYQYARDANCMDFLGISEHNHSQAGMNIANYPKGFADANTINGVVSPTTGNSIITLWGMEWGVISGGGHVVTYGFDDKLIGWEAGNYDIFCAKNDYSSLFNLINGQPNAFATLAHPNWDPNTSTSDFGNLTYTPYSSSADNAIVGTTIESGPAFSTDTTYSNFPFALGYFDYYKLMLAKGYRLGASMDGDNHNLTFGKQSTNRLVVLAASRTRTDLVAAMKAMRFYASNDCNIRVDYKLYSNVMGSSLTHAGVPGITLNVTDPDPSDIVDSIYIYGAKIGDPAPVDPIKKYFNVSSVTFNSSHVENIQPNNSDWYYFATVKQQDGNRVITSPIWYSRNDAVTSITDNFRSKQSGNWNDVNTWESSVDNSTWVAATSTPDYNSNTITVRHNINVTAAVSIDQTVINAGDTVFVNPGIVLTVNDGIGVDLIINTGGNVTVRSSASGTGSIGNSPGTISSGTGSGTITVERYISDKRAWRLLAIPFYNRSAPSIKTAWMEGATNSSSNPNRFYGTHITTFAGDVNANNFDAVKPSSSIRTFSGDNFSSDAIHTPDPNSSIAANSAYFLFVRGDRSIDLNNSLSHSATTLRITGFTTAHEIGLGLQGTNFSLIPNPYPSAINFDSVKSNPANSGVNTFYVWDASMGAVGNYRTISISGTSAPYTYSATPGGNDNNWRFIESGSAFLVPGKVTMSFTEPMKTSGLPPSSMLRTTTVSTKETQLSVNLNVVNADNTISLADGVREVFDNNYTSYIDNNDAKKIEGFDLNLGITSNNEILAVEKRPFPLANEVITLKLWNSKTGNYQFEVQPANIPSQISVAYLFDKYLNIYTSIDLKNSSVINFSITSEAQSAAENRFSIVFAKALINLKPSIIIYPNPVKNGHVQIQMNNMPKGNYVVKLINNLGQTVLSTKVNHAEGSSIETISTNKISGVFMLEVIQPDQRKTITKLIIN